MTITPVKIPAITKRIFPNYVWDFSSKEKTIYLTFDDGPTPEVTTKTLDILNKYNAKATFFCIGKNVENHPTIFNEIIKNGHAIGNHTQNHIKGWKTKTKVYLKDVLKAENSINKHLKRSQIKLNLFRPPYGQIKPKQGKKLIALGYQIIMWNVLSLDYSKAITKEHCLNNVISKATNGSIVVFHDSIKASEKMLYTLPKVLDYFSKKGYDFKAIRI